MGTFVTTPAARSTGQAIFTGLEISARFVGRTTLRAVGGISSIIESSYTRIRGREAYLEHEIAELRDQITRLEQRVD